MKYILLLLFIGFKLQAQEPCALPYNIPEVPVAQFDTVQAASLGNTILLPKFFKNKQIEVLDSNGSILSDTLFYVAKGKNAWFKQWMVYSLPNIAPRDRKREIKPGFSAKQHHGADSLHAAHTATYKLIDECHSYNSYHFTYVSVGTQGKYGVMLKTIVVGYPPTGSLIAHQILYTYKLRKAKRYRDIGYHIINNFTAQYYLP